MKIVIYLLLFATLVFGCSKNPNKNIAPTHLGSIEKQNELMIEEGRSQEVICILQAYIDDISSLTGVKLSSIYSSKPDASSPFLDFPIITAIAALELSINTICNYETRALEYCANEMGACCL